MNPLRLVDSVRDVRIFNVWKISRPKRRARRHHKTIPKRYPKTKLLLPGQGWGSHHKPLDSVQFTNPCDDTPYRNAMVLWVSHQKPLDSLQFTNPCDDTPNEFSSSFHKS